MDEAEEVESFAVVPGCEAAEVLELVEASLDAVAQSIELRIVPDGMLAGRVGGDHGYGADAAIASRRMRLS